MDAAFLGELGIVQQKTKVFEDNQAAISIDTSLSVSGNCRHVVMRYSRVREAVQNGTLEVIYVPTNQQYADTLTKWSLPLISLNIYLFY